MKRGRLPLTALRSFEAAGRHLSFGRAAEELFVSQAAISRQIRELEAFVGVPLFRRTHRGVELTEVGETLIGQLTISFDGIDNRLTQIMERTRASLHVSVEPSFAGEFLIQRLDHFQQLHPNIDISIDADSRLVEFRSHDAEIAIRYGATATSWPRVEALHLLDLRLAPVAAKGLLLSGKPLASPADLQNHTLIHDQSREAWSNWFQAAGFSEPERPGPVYTEAALAMHATRLGHGVALGDRILDGDDLRAGRLVRLFDLEISFGAYWLVAPSLKRLSPSARAFADWVVLQVKPPIA